MTDRSADPSPPSGPRSSRLRGRVGALRETVRHTTAATRERVTALDVALRAIERFGEINGSILAGYLAYRLFLLILPLVVIAVAVSGFSADATRAASDQLRLGQTVLTTIATASQDTDRSRVPLLISGVVAFAVAAWGFLGALQVTSAQAWGIPTRRFPGKSRTFLQLAGSLLLFALVFYVSALVRQAGVLAGLAGTTTTLLSEFAAYLGLGWILPRRCREWYWLLPGASLAALGHLGLQVLATWWLPEKLAGASQTYGTLGLTLTILSYLFLIGLLLTISPVVNAVMWGHFQGSPPGLLQRIARLVPIPTDALGSGYVPEGGTVEATVHVPRAGGEDG
jgi:membrane protein